MAKSFSRTAHSWYRLYSWPCVCAVAGLHSGLQPAAPYPASTALTYPTDYCSVPGGFNKPLQEYLPIKVLWMCLVHVRTFDRWREQSTVFDHCWSHEFSLPPFLFFKQDWGRPGDLWNLEIQWHVPSAEETAFVFYVLDLLLQPELQRLQKYALESERKWAGQVSKVHSVIMVKTKKHHSVLI